MKTARFLKRVSVVMLTLALLAGMLSVMGAFSVYAGVEETEVFRANFSQGLNSYASWGGAISGNNYNSPLNDPAVDTSAKNVSSHNWLAERFDSYMNFTSTAKRTYFGQGDANKGSHFVFAQRAAVHNGNADRSLMHNNFDPNGELFWSINTLVPKANGEVLKVKNFEATVKFAMTNNLSGGLLFGFHETNGGVYTFKNPYIEQVSSGSVLAIGNVVNSATGNDAWKFYDNGVVEAKTMTSPDKDFGRTLGGQWYTLTVRVVNGTATFTLVSADGTINETMTKAVSTTEGAISIGLSGREIMVNEIAVTNIEVKEPVSFTANFSAGLDANAEFQWAGGTNYNSFMNNPEAEGATDKTKNSHAWMSERFDSYICMDTKDYANFSKRSYFGQNDAANSYFLYAQRGNVGTAGADRGLFFNNATSDNETFWHINTLVPKVDGEAINVKNFEATVKFAFLQNDISGGLLFAFHEAHPGRYIYNWNYSERYHSGSLLAIGNKVDGAVGNDAWKFFDAGSVLEDEYLYSAETLGKTLSDQYYTLTVKAVDGTATFTLAGKDGAVVKTMTTAYTSTEGGISIGVSGRATIINEITVKEMVEEEHDCDFNTPNYDENNHWNECECGEKDDLIAHVLTFVVDGDKHYQVCDCGYATDAVNHNFAEGDCACGVQKPNTVKVEGTTLTVKADAGYELKAGSLIVKDATGAEFVPVRVGYRENGNASQYTVPEAAVAPYEVSYEFIQPGATSGYNAGFLGTSTNATNGGLRFVHHFEIDKDGNMLYEGEKVAVKEYGLLVASAAILPNASDLDIETAEDSMHVHRIKWGCADGSKKFFDRCDSYAQISVQIVGIPEAAADLDFHTRAYIVLENDEVVYMDAVTANFNNG